MQIKARGVSRLSRPSVRRREANDAATQSCAGSGVRGGRGFLRPPPCAILAPLWAAERPRGTAIATVESSPSADDDAIVEVRGLAKTFRVGFWARPVDALRGVSFSLRRGESLGYLGPNGSGKTTSIKCLLGLVQPTRGEIALFHGRPSDPVVRARIGFLAEAPYFYDYLTPVEVIDYVGKLCGLDARTRKARATELLGLVGLDGAARRPLRGFSKGMLQRVGIAQSLVADPDLLVWDEPLSGLDPVGRKEVRELMVELRRQGKSLFFSSHVLTDIEALCDAVCILDQGVAVAQGRLGDLLQADALQSEAVVELLPDDDAGRAALAALPGAEVSSLPGGARVALPTTQVGELCRLVAARGLTLVEVGRRRDSLEELFLRKAVARRGEAG